MAGSEFSLVVILLGLLLLFQTIIGAPHGRYVDGQDFWQDMLRSCESFQVRVTMFRPAFGFHDQGFEYVLSYFSST